MDKVVHFEIPVDDPQVFVNKIVGTQGMYETTQIEDYLRTIIVSRFNDIMGETMKTLLDLPSQDPQVKVWAGYSTSVFLIGWATGGIFFGILGDRWGRVKTMLLTILLYSMFNSFKWAGLAMVLRLV